MAFMSEVVIDRKNEDELRRYLTANRKRDFPYHIPWKGPRPVRFDVYKVPIKALHFNFNNTRLRAELDGRLYQDDEKANPESKNHQEIVENILLESKWIGEIETKRLTEDLQLRGQLDPAVATVDGVLIDGNRRLAIFRRLTRSRQNPAFSQMEVCVLPRDATIDDLKELEMRIQMSHSFKVGYGKINAALEFRSLHRDLDWTLQRIESVTGKEFKKSEINGMIEIIDLIDGYLEFLPPRGAHRKRYADLDKGWESFANLNNILSYFERRRVQKDELERIRLLGFGIIRYESSTYADIRNLGNVLKDRKAANKLREQSDTLNGRKLNDFLEPDRIAREVENLRLAREALKQSQEDPKRSLRLALKRLDGVKISRVKKNDNEFFEILQALKRRIAEIEKQLG